MAHLGKVMVLERGHESSNLSHAAILKRKSGGMGRTNERVLPTCRSGDWYVLIWYAAVAQLVGGNSLKLCTVRVRIPLAAPEGL